MTPHHDETSCFNYTNEYFAYQVGSKLSFVTVTVKDAADDHVIWAWVSPYTEEGAADAI